MRRTVGNRRRLQLRSTKTLEGRCGDAWKISLTVLLAISVIVLPRPARAQATVPGHHSLVALARRDLRFGTVLPGIPNHVSVFPGSGGLSLHRAGLFEIRGPDHTSVRLDFTLPPEMLSDGFGHSLPLSFASGDGVVAKGLLPIPFDPNGPFVGTLGVLGQLWVVLGGTALPSPQQPGGIYRATIILTVSQLGS